MTGLRMAGHMVTGKSALIVTTGTIKTNKKQPVHIGIHVNGLFFVRWNIGWLGDYQMLLWM